MHGIPGQCAQDEGRQADGAVVQPGQGRPRRPAAGRPEMRDMLSGQASDSPTPSGRRRPGDGGEVASQATPRSRPPGTRAAGARSTRSASRMPSTRPTNRPPPCEPAAAAGSRRARAGSRPPTGSGRTPPRCTWFPRPAPTTSAPAAPPPGGRPAPTRRERTAAHLDGGERHDRDQQSGPPAQHRRRGQADAQRREQPHQCGQPRALGERRRARVALMRGDEGVDADDDELPKKQGRRSPECRRRAARESGRRGSTGRSRWLRPA